MMSDRDAAARRVLPGGESIGLTGTVTNVTLSTRLGFCSEYTVI